MCYRLLFGYLILSTIFNVMLSQRTRHPREIYFCLLRSVGAKNYGLVSSDARKEAGEKILPQGVYGRARPSGGRNLRSVSNEASVEYRQKDAFAGCIRLRLPDG